MTVVLTALAQLPADFQANAKEVRRLAGDERAAHVWEAASRDVESRLRAASLEALDLPTAAGESGYTRNHLVRMLREGKIPDSGSETTLAFSGCTFPESRVSALTRTPYHLHPLGLPAGSGCRGPSPGPAIRRFRRCRWLSILLEYLQEPYFLRGQRWLRPDNSLVAGRLSARYWPVIGQSVVSRWSR